MIDIISQIKLKKSNIEPNHQLKNSQLILKITIWSQ